MLNNIQAIIKACNKLDIKYTTLHKSQNVLLVKTKKEDLLFTNRVTPFNNEAVSNICKDKDFTYNLFHEYLNLPKTISFCDPNLNEEYKEYIEFSSHKLIKDQIINNFSLPVIVKKNSGSQGINVFKCNTEQEILISLQIIFDKKSNHYDYVAIAQEYINIKREFRVILFQGEIMLAYEKIIDEASFIGNLSPLHWENSRTLLIKDLDLLAIFKQALQGVLQFPEFKYLGVDIVIDNNDRLWVIELNSHPGYTRFLLDNDQEILVDMFVKILRYYV